MRRPALVAAFYLLFTSLTHAAGIQVTRVGNNLIEITGGAGPNAWHIQYGSESALGSLTLSGPGSIAYFTHATWLRQVDVEKGVVTGRWRFPGDAIVALKRNGDSLQVVVEQTGQRDRFRRTLDFNPAAPSVPSWTSDSFAAHRTASLEAYRMLHLELRLRAKTLTPEIARKLIPEAENAVKRDPSAPWQRIILGRLYRVAGVNDGRRMFEEAVRTEPADYTELLEISDFLESMDEKELAQIAFERGEEDFWRRGHDPRLVSNPTGSLNRIATLREANLVRESVSTTRSLGNTLAIATALAALVYVAGLSVRYRREKPQRHFKFEYWTATERIAFGTIVAFAWLACGFAGTAWRGFARTVAFQRATASGSMAGPAAIAILEAIPPTADRDFILATAYHRDGQLAKAEPLYRLHPQFAESWNNLGVLLMDSGKKEEAQNALQQAIELNPELSEAKLNLGSGSSDIWSGAHWKHLPGKPMIAVFRGDQLVRAAMGGSMFDVFLQSFLGVSTLGSPEVDDIRLSPPIFLMGTSMMLVLGLLLLPMLLAPRLYAVQSGGRFQISMEILFPGIAKAWGVAGGLALVVFIACALWSLSTGALPALFGLLSLWSINGLAILRRRR